MNGSILKVSEEQWRHAQKDELHHWATQGSDGDDWNAWWADKFDYYCFLRCPTDVLEVGCGPYAGNAKRILELRKTVKTLVLQDPLMAQYREQEKAVVKMPGMWSASSLEEFQWPYRFDTIICINVLDHVQDVQKCFWKMHEYLYSGGTLIIGQDLTNEFDMANCPEMRDDPMHPIKISLEAIAPFLFVPYETEFLRILPRAEGRNPKAHYATLLWAGKKK